MNAPLADTVSSQMQNYLGFAKQYAALLLIGNPDVKTTGCGRHDVRLTSQTTKTRILMCK